MLIGMATKNSILLVKHAILGRREHGMTQWEALLDAWRKRARLIIIMTTLAMGAGMMPIGIALGAADTSFRASLAIAVTGRLITSMFPSLLIFSAVLAYIDDLGQ